MSIKLYKEEYADNLISYLSNARSCRTITIDDLSNVVHGIAARSFDLEGGNEDSKTIVKYMNRCPTRPRNV